MLSGVASEILDPRLRIGSSLLNISDRQKRLTQCESHVCALVNSSVRAMDPQCGMALDTIARRPEGLTSDERWAAWVARGVEHDKKFTKRARAILMAIVVGVVLWLSIALLR